MKLVQEWKRAHKWLSVQLAGALVLLDVAMPYLPMAQQYLPQHWVAVAAGLIIVARVIQQKRPDDATG